MAIDDLLQKYPLLNDQDKIELLKELNENTRNIIQELADVLNSAKKHLWVSAILVIHDMGYPRNKPILPLLVEHLSDGNWPGWKECIEALSDIDVQIIAPIFIKLLLNQGEAGRYWMDDVEGIGLALAQMPLKYSFPCIPSILYILAKWGDFDEPEPKILLDVIQRVPVTHYSYAIPTLINIATRATSYQARDSAKTLLNTFLSEEIMYYQLIKY